MFLCFNNYIIINLNIHKYYYPFELLNCRLNKKIKNTQIQINQDYPSYPMNSPHQTGHFNFSNANDSQFLADQRNTADLRQTSMTNYPPGTQTQTQNAIQARYHSFGQNNLPSNYSGDNYNAATMNRMTTPTQPYSVNVMPATSTKPTPITSVPYTSPTTPINTQIQPQPKPQPQPQVQQSQPGEQRSGKMPIMHRPDVQSIRYTNQNYPLNGSLQTIHEQRSSAYQSQFNPSQNMIGRSTQGYNISEIQRKQYEKDKNLQEDAKCCFCFKKK